MTPEPTLVTLKELEQIEGRIALGTNAAEREALCATLRRLYNLLDRVVNPRSEYAADLEDARTVLAQMQEGTDAE